MRMPDFDLPTADGGRFTSSDLEGKPWVAYLSRHTGCYVCQHHLAKLLERRAEIQAQGGDVVVFMPVREQRLKDFFAGSDLPRDLTVVADPDTKLFDALGTKKGDLFAQLGKTAKSLWTSRDQLAKWRLTRDDMTRMGADLVIAPDGELVFKHICESPSDRATPSELVAALRSAVPAAA